MKLNKQYTDKNRKQEITRKKYEHTEQQSQKKQKKNSD